MSDKVLIIVGDATETVDTLYPYLRVQEEGFVPVVAGPEARRYNMVLHEVPADGWDITREFEGYTIQADIAFRDIEPAEYVGIFYSGGRAPEYVRDDPDLIEIPARAGCVEGRRMATVPKCQFDLEVCGGTFVNEPCVVDGNMVSGRTWHDHGHYMKYWINLLIAERERMLAQ